MLCRKPRSDCRSQLRASYPTIPWQQISGFRNILVHNYLGDIDSQSILTIVREHLPPLESAIRDMLVVRDPNET